MYLFMGNTVTSVDTDKRRERERERSRDKENCLGVCLLMRNTVHREKERIKRKTEINREKETGKK